jgi:hypothetical protein
MRGAVFEGIHTHDASGDTRKIIRSTYPVPDYIALDKEVKYLWRYDPLYN